MLEILPVRGRRDFRRFIDYAYTRNAVDPNWVPPLRLGEQDRLNPKKNPFFAHADVELFIAVRDGRVAGRVAAIDDRLHNETHGDNLAMFGLFEADDVESSRTLLARAEAWAGSRGRSAMRGPINPSMNDNCGLLVSGFDTKPMLLMPHNPPEYAGFIEASGYAKVKDLYAWIYELGQPVPEVVRRLAERRRERLALTIRTIRMHEFLRDADRLRELYAGAWGKNWASSSEGPLPSVVARKIRRRYRAATVGSGSSTGSSGRLPSA